MFLNDISLVNFRNYKNLKIKLGKNINIIYGNNGQGKTNILESIYVLALTKSHKSYLDNNLIFLGKEQSKIAGTIFDNSIKTKLSINLTNKSKNLLVDNNIENKINKYVSIMNIIFFYPEDLELVKGTPIIRRKYLNTQLSQLYPNYLVILNDYNKLLKTKNLFLKTSLLNNKINKDYYDILNKHLIEKAAYIYIIRNKYITKINEIVEKIFFDLTGIHNFTIKYKTSILNNYEKENLCKELMFQINANSSNEVKLKKSLVGPHLDDFEFYIGNLNLKSFGSQGQQRMAVLATKLSEIKIFKKYKNTTPILLLDDVFSELDNKKKHKFIKYIDSNIQSIITTTDIKNISKKVLLNAKIYKINEGQIIEEV